MWLLFSILICPETAQKLLAHLPLSKTEILAGPIKMPPDGVRCRQTHRLPSSTQFEIIFSCLPDKVRRLCLIGILEMRHSPTKKIKSLNRSMPRSKVSFSNLFGDGASEKLELHPLSLVEANIFEPFCGIWIVHHLLYAKQVECFRFCQAIQARHLNFLH